MRQMNRKYLSILPALVLVLAFYSQYSFSAKELSEEQLSLLDGLPPDQRESVMEKMNQANKLNEELEGGFENFKTFQDRPEKIELSVKEKEDYLKKSTNWIFGYELFQYCWKVSHEFFQQ